jgi:hypothetical protein
MTSEREHQIIELVLEKNKIEEKLRSLNLTQEEILMVRDLEDESPKRYVSWLKKRVKDYEKLMNSLFS